MLIAGEVPAVPPTGLDGLLPAWAQGLSLLTILILIIAAWLRGWVVTRSEAERMVASERRVSEIHEANAKDSIELNKQLTQAFAPVLEQNAAILRVVESIQEEQQRMRERRPGR